jgi:hypothetical protein
MRRQLGPLPQYFLALTDLNLALLVLWNSVFYEERGLSIKNDGYNIQLFEAFHGA